MRTECLNCKYGGINFWNYIECCKFDQELDGSKTTHTAIRERHAQQFNKYNNCQYYEPKNFIQRIKDFIGSKL